MATFGPVGHNFHRVLVPLQAIDCPTMTVFKNELAKVLPGGANAGASVQLHLSNGVLDYGNIGIRNYNVSDGGDGLEIYGNFDGSTRLRYNAAGSMSESNGAVFRIGSADNANQTNDGIKIYNLEIDGTGTLHTANGAIWGAIIGASHTNDKNAADTTNVHMQGCHIHHSRQSGLKIHGNGGTGDVHVFGCTMEFSGLQYNTPGDSSTQSAGYGEGCYVGDGNGGDSWHNVTIESCHVKNVTMGEGIELKRNGTNGLVVNNLVHDVTIDNGGAIKLEDNNQEYTVRNNRVFNVSSTVHSDSDGVGIFATGGGIIENNIVWDCELACFAYTRALSSLSLIHISEPTRPY